MKYGWLHLCKGIGHPVEDIPDCGYRRNAGRHTHSPSNSPFPSPMLRAPVKSRSQGNRCNSLRTPPGSQQLLGSHLLQPFFEVTTAQFFCGISPPKLSK